MKVLVDASTLISLGAIGELELLTCIDGALVIPERVRSEVSSEPASSNLERLCRESKSLNWQSSSQRNMLIERSKSILNAESENGDVIITAAVLQARELDGRDIGVVSDDKRVRTVAKGFGATITGTVGVIARAVEDRGLTAEQGRELIRQVDSHGLHMTGELREKAYELVEEAAESE